jgi:tRNA threonylcarbamoyladenosine biosynthesis protein TsaB
MLVLAVETAVEQVGVAVADHRGPLASASLVSDRRHAESLAPLTEFVCRQAGVELADLDAIVVDNGPGLFTGLRVGMAHAAATAWALGIPVVEVSSLEVLAAAAAPLTAPDVPVASVIDARRGEVYWTLHRVRTAGARFHLTELHPPTVGPVADLATHLRDRREPTLCVGTGALRYRDDIVGPDGSGTVTVAPEAWAMPPVEILARIGADRAEGEQWCDAERIAPVYLRAPDAEIRWATRQETRDGAGASS